MGLPVELQTDGERVGRFILQEDQGGQELAPGLDGGKDDHHRDGRLGQRQDDPEENLELVGAVDPRLL